MGKAIKSVGSALGLAGGTVAKPQSVSKSFFDINKEVNPAKEEYAKLLQRSSQAGAATADRAGVLQQMGQAALGQGPSLAEAQMKAAQDRNLAQQLAALQTQRGGGALGQRALLQNMGASGQQLAQQASIARLGERNDYLNQAGAAESGLRSDIAGKLALDLKPKEAMQAYETQRVNAANAAQAAQAAQQAQGRGALLGGLSSMAGSMLGPAGAALGSKLGGMFSGDGTTGGLTNFSQASNNPNNMNLSGPVGDYSQLANGGLVSRDKNLASKLTGAQGYQEGGLASKLRDMGTITKEIENPAPPVASRDGAAPINPNDMQLEKERKLMNAVSQKKSAERMAKEPKKKTPEDEGYTKRPSKFAKGGHVDENTIIPDKGWGKITIIDKRNEQGTEHYDKGGKVKGPGTETSDSIPAMLSDGEFVIKASEVKKPGILAHLMKINEGTLTRKDIATLAQAILNKREANMADPNVPATPAAPEDMYGNLISASSLRNDPMQIQQLVDSGQLSQETADRLQANEEAKAGLSAQKMREDSAAASAKFQETTNPAQYAQEAQQNIDTLEGAAMQGTGIQPGYAPISTAPVGIAAPNQISASPVGAYSTGLPATMQAPIQDNSAQFQAEAQAQADAIKQQEAQNQAATQLAQEKANQIAQAKQQVDQQKLATEDKVKEDIKKSGSNIWQNVADAVAIMLGATSQTYSGSKDNPGLKAIEKRLDQEAATRKYNSEQEAALRKLAIDAADFQLRKMATLTDNQLKLAQIGKLQTEISQLGQQAGTGQELATLLNKKSLSRDEVAALQTMGEKGKDMASLYIHSPMGNQMIRGLGTNEQMTKLKTYMGDVGTVVPELNEIINLAQSGEYSKLNPADRAVMQTKIGALVGKLRIPFTGPGVLTNDERKFLLNTIGDPNSLMSLPSWQISRLKEVRSNMNTNVKNAYKSYAGVELPDDLSTQAEKRTAQSAATVAAKGYSPETIAAATERARAKKANK